MPEKSERWRIRWMTCLVLLAAVTGSAGCFGPRPASHGKRGPLHHYQLARMHFEQGKVTEALEEIERSLRLDDSLPQTHHYKGYIYWSREQWEKATLSFERAIELQPYFTDARMFYSTCLENLGRIDDAFEQLNLALRDKTYGAREKIHLNRGMILKRQGRLGEALTELRTSVEIKPRYYRAHYEMATLLDEMGRLDEALSAFQTAAVGYEKHAKFQLDHGAALFRRGLRPAAAKLLRRVMDLAPGSESAARARELLEVID